uniref:splicing factor 45 isoform X1 n=1 Tax=Myxine glutinosa TaxID=7769 RepID=UPI00359023D5
MSLYDDITMDAGGPQAEGWSKNFKMLQTQLQVKKVTLTQAKQSQRVRQGSTLAPVVDLKKQVVSEERQLFSDPILSLNIGPKDAAILGEALCFVADEYDPLYPNDYEKVMKRQRDERQRQREIERQKDMDDREKKRKERPEGGGLVPGPDSDDDDEYEAEKRKRVLGGATIAPPSSLMNRDKEVLPVEEDSTRHSRMGGKAAIPPPIFDDVNERSRSPPVLPGTFLSNMGGTVAHKIMAKYGFREGQGLGKHEQGLSTALSVEKTSKRGGKIVIGEMQEKDVSATIPLASGAKKTADQSLNPLTKMLKNPTKVVLLRNMVGAGEVDEDLEGETKEECEKYGKVIRCLIFELPTSNDEEAVRIFLEFERIESAIKAVVDLNGRYFGGRVVKASFYNLDKFRRLDLGEHISP